MLAELPIFGNIWYMSKNTSISLNEHFTKFIDEKIQDGRYSTASDVVRAGLRLLEEEEVKLIQLRKAIEEGERSGIAEDFDFETFIQSKKS